MIAVAGIGDDPEILAGSETWPNLRDVSGSGTFRIDDANDGERAASRAHLAMLARNGTGTASPAQMRLAIGLLTEAQACRQMKQRLPMHIQLRLATLRYETGLVLDPELL